MTLGGCDVREIVEFDLRYIKNARSVSATVVKLACPPIPRDSGRQAAFGSWVPSLGIGCALWTAPKTGPPILRPAFLGKSHPFIWILSRH